uniref:Intersectin 2a n=1 Tax=Poecilia formosa TaxID=48698 RepID=A0A096M4V6_POEFO
MLLYFLSGGSSVWTITPEERGKHDKQFDTLSPILGYISGEQARKFFLQSGLPPSVLAEIWNLADMDSDGKMDRLEFSIAMKLIKLTLQGRNLPSSLPVTMKQPPTLNSGSNMSSSARFGMGSMPNLSVGLSSMPTISTMPVLTPMPANRPVTSVQPLVPVPMALPLITSFGNSGLPNGTVSLLTPPLVASNAGTPMSGFSSPMAFSPSPGVSKANSLLDLGSSSSNSSSTTSLASSSPKMGSGDWAVPQASRLKYRQQFNTLDKLMSGYLSAGPQVRNALMASNLTQTQLATIWYVSLADVDKDGQLRAEEFILAMHLVDMAKTGHPLPLTLPQDLIPPSLRGGIKSSELLNGTGPYISPSLMDTTEIEPPQKNKSSGVALFTVYRSSLVSSPLWFSSPSVSYEDKLKENFARGSAELEKRRLAKEASGSRVQTGERRDASFFRSPPVVVRSGGQKEAEQEEIVRLRARKKSLELELEAVGNKHKQITDRLRDAQSMRRIQKAEVDLINQKRDARIAEINTLQLEFEEWQRKLSQLVPEQQRLSEKLRNISLKKLPPAALTSLAGSAAESSGNCRRLKDQLDVLEKETTDKLAQMEQYNKELKLGDMDDCLLRGLLSLLACLSQLFLLIKNSYASTYSTSKMSACHFKFPSERQCMIACKFRMLVEKSSCSCLHQELREKQTKQQAVLDDLHRVKEEKKQKQQGESLKSLSQRNHRFRSCRLAKRAAQLTSYRALYSFLARNAEELSIDADCVIEVDEHTVGEPGWLCGNYQGKRGWFPQSYAEKCPTPPTPEAAPASSSLPPLNTRNAAVDATEDSRVPLFSAASQVRPHSGVSENVFHIFTKHYKLKNIHNLYSPAMSDTPCIQHGQSTVLLAARAISSWSPASETHLNLSPDMGGALLSFSQGDLISVLQQRDDWWLGQLNGTRGWFPKSYVTPESAGNAEYEDAHRNTDLSVALKCNRLPDSNKCSLSELEYVALYTYESPETGDLTFDEGDVIMVTEREGEWWRGCIGDKTGLFPSNYVRPVESELYPNASKPGVSSKKPEIVQAVTATEAPTAYQLTLSPGQLIVVRAKNSTGWWLGELQARGKKRQKGWFHSSHVKLLGPSSAKTCLSPLPVCQVIAMYDYAAANRDELSFSKGQLINILDKTNPDWWKGETNGVTGLLPTNYVKMTTESDPSQQCKDLITLDTMTPQERKRQGYIHELFHTEETYVDDLELVLEVFHKPMSESGRLTEAEMATIFVNWRELIMCNTRLLNALRERKQTGGENMPVQLIGDLLASELAHMQPYVCFCSSQLNAAALLQAKTHSQPEFKDFLKKVATNYRCKGMPLSSFLLKPMQRLTRYPLLIKNILEHTPEGHEDREPLREALERAEELCSQVNEAVREKENADRLEWIQNHIQCEGPIEHLVFSSLTNCLGPRKLLHSGRLFKTKSSRELWAFLFNDFLLLTHSAKPFSSSGSEKLFSPKTNIQLKIYKTPLFLNEVLVKMPADPSSDEPLFHVSHIDRVYTLKTETLSERTAWVQKIKAASEHFIETEKKKREKAYQARSLKSSGIGRLLVTVIEAQELKACKPNGKSNPYCELTMGAQCYTSRPVLDTLNPKWNFNCQFFIRDIYQDVLSITVFEKDQFSPDDFLGRAEVPVATIKKDMESKGAATRRLLLHEVPTGEVSVKLDLQLYEQYFLI